MANQSQAYYSTIPRPYITDRPDSETQMFESASETSQPLSPVSGFAPPPASAMPSPARYTPRPISLEESRSHSYTAVDVDESGQNLERSSSPLPPADNVNLTWKRPTPPSSPQAKYREFARQGSFQAPKSPAWIRDQGKPTRTRRVCSWLLTAVPLAGTALLVLQTLSSHRPKASTLRSPHQLNAYATPFPNEHPYEPHPIHELMREADRLWEEKVAKQSRTYEEAVKEYRRRNGRSPPKGFDVWYEWAVANGVQLIDEYDSISTQILPLHSLSPAELRRRIQPLEDTNGLGRDHAILSITGGKRHYGGAKWRDPVGESFEGLIKEIGHLLPDMKLPIYLHDASYQQLDYEWLQAYKAAARAGELIDEAQLSPLDAEIGWNNRERTCAPDSPFRRSSNGLENHVPPAGPSFIRDHKRSMEFCENPAIADLHGATSGNWVLRKLGVSFAMSVTSVDGDLVWPSTIQYNLNPPNELPFLEKPVHKVVWRGSPDGIWVSGETKWRESQRFRLLYLTTSNSTLPRTVRQTFSDRLGREYQKDIITDLAELNERYMNIKPTQGPVQCRETLCEYLRGTMQFVPKASLEEMASHRYVMDVDGNAYSARFRTHLLSNQVPLKATIYKEWYYDRIQPWRHYVPVKQDYSDLYNVLAFFDGGLGPDRPGHHDLLGEKIAREGRQWAEQFWRTEDMTSYLFRLLLEYARLFDPDQRSHGSQ